MQLPIRVLAKISWRAIIETGATLVHPVIDFPLNGILDKPVLGELQGKVLRLRTDKAFHAKPHDV